MNEKTTKEIQSYTLNKAFFLFAVKKTERLTRAVYLITNFFRDDEPLKWKLREENLSLLESLSLITDNASQVTPVDLSFIKRSLEMSLASLAVAHTAGLISEMNYGVLRSEYESLLSSLHAELESDGNHSPLFFPKDFFAVENARGGSHSHERFLYGTVFERPGIERKSTPRELEERVREESEARETLERAEEERAKPFVSKGQSEPIKDIKDIKRTETQKPERTPVSSGVGQKTNRRDLILQLIKEKKEISVKDAAREIRDCSEKTLQRELVALVNDGTLERVGARRWSRYRFA
jgi:hypothetical protein